MDSTLSGRTAVVTGAVTGIGEASARLLADRGADVVVEDQNGEATYVNGEVVSVDGGAAWVNSVRPAGGAGRWDPSEIDDSIRAQPEER